MIAEPTLVSRSSVQKENSIVDVATCGSVNHTLGSVRNENRQKTVRGKRKAREGSENAKRKHSKTSNGSLGRANDHLKNGDIEAVTLFEVVTMGKSAMQAVVDDWIEAYIMDRDTALLDLISFFIQCSGCKGVVTAEMVQSKQDTDVMSKMVEDLDEGSGLQYKKFLAFPWILTVTWPMDMDSGEYPLIMSGLYWKRFRSHFCEFVSVLVTQCQYSVIFDSYLMNTLISLLTELSDSRVRAFRHTCTLAAVKLLSALVNVALNLGVSVDNSQRLYEVEHAKTPSKRAVPRLERIQRKISELQDKKLEIENMMDVIFKGVFLKRYRDVIPEIRAICMEELTVWMKLYNPVFLNDSYLKYVGWMLHDKQPDVRLKCVLGLQGLYEDAHLSPKMDLFTIRFKERMISMTLDKDHEVAVQAMRLLMGISQWCEDVLGQDDYKHMFQFVYSSHRPLAATAGEFLYTKLLSSPAVTEPGPATSEQDRCRDLTLARVRALLHFFKESELHQHVVYLVDSLWDCGAALLKDWASLTSLLLHHSSPEPGQATGLTSTEEEPGQATGLSSAEEEPGQATGRSNTEEEPGQATGRSNTEEEPGQATGLSSAKEEPGQAIGLSSAEEEPGQATGRSNTEEEPGQATGLSSAKEEPGQATGLSSAEEGPGQATGLSSAEEEPGQATGLSSAEEEPGQATGLSSTEEEPGHATGLSSAEEGLVIDILLASVRQAAEGPPLAGRGTGKKVISAKEKKSQIDDCVGLTEHFLKVLPELLSKYSEDTEKVTSFLKIPQYFQMEHCDEEYSEPLQALLAQVERAVDGHTDAGLLEAAARTYQTLCSEDSAWHSLASPAMDQVVRRWTHTLGTLLDDALSDGTFTADEEKRGAILSSLKKLTAFHNAQDLSKWGLYELGTKLLVVETQHGCLPVQVTMEALRCVCYSLLWKLNTFGEVATSRETALHQRSQLRAFCEKCLRCLSHSEQQVREQAFMSLCDILIAHSYQLQMWDPSAGTPLLYTPDPKLQRALLTFILEHVFTGTELDGHSSRASESESEASRLEDLHRRRNLLAAYCKLIIHSVLEMSTAAEVFKQYMKYYNDFGDIIKETLNRTRQMDKIESARTLVLCLQQLFLRLKQEQDSGNTCSSGVQTYSSIKELARRFSLTFGWDQIKSRESLAMIHRDGIEFVFQGFVQQAERHSPPYISYLTILSEFSSKLLKPDKKTVCSYLQRYAGEQTINNREECWLPLIYYRASLQGTAEGEDAVSYISSDTVKQPSLTNRSRSPSLRQATPDGDARATLTLSCIGTKGSRTLKPSTSPDETKAVEQSPAAREPPTGGVPSDRQEKATTDEVDVDTVEIDV